MGAITQSAQTLRPGYTAPKDPTDPRDSMRLQLSLPINFLGEFLFFSTALMLLYTTPETLAVFQQNGSRVRLKFSPHV